MLICNHQLNTAELASLEALRNQCKAHDGNIVANYKHLLCENRPFPCNLLYYQQGQLVGFLSTFFFYEDAAEIILMVAPNCRKQGLATQLINEILPLLRLQRIKTLIFSVPIGLNNHGLRAHGFHYLNGQYQMQRQGQSVLKLKQTSLSIRRANETDLDLLCTIDNACFPSSLPNRPSHFLGRIGDPNYHILIAEMNGVAIGKAHLHFQLEGARLTDLAILPHHQGCGLGGALLAHCINHSLAHHHMTIKLDVETNNQKALQLYSNVGFAIENAYDFWSIPIEVLRFAKH